MSYIEILLSFETVIMLGAVGVAFACYRRAYNDASLVSDMLCLSYRGKIIFDRKGKFYKANDYAISCLSEIIDEDINKITLSKLFNYLYDHAADFDESIMNTILRDVDGDDIPAFREVVNCGDQGLILVEAQKIQHGLIILSLSDISIGQEQEADLIKVNNFNYQLVQAIQATANGIVISNPKEKENPILFANDAFCEIVGRDHDEVIAGDWNVIADMLSNKGDVAEFLDAISSARDIDLVLEKGEGDNKRFFNIKLTPVSGDDGYFDLFIGVLSEITLLKQKEAEVFHAQKLESLGQLAAGVAHDFNNILSIIGGYSVMAAGIIGESNENKQAIKFLNKVDAAAKRGASLTSKMLAFSKHKVVSQSVIDVCNVIKEQQELLIPLLDAGMDLQVDLPDRAVNMRGSCDSLSQVIMNFVVNGRDAMPDGGKLTISVKCLAPDKVSAVVSDSIDADEYICISVSDTGTGMDKKTIKKIFDPFFSTKDQGKGTGLGLSVVYGLVKEMGGVLNVSSVVGQGTTMSIYFPLCHEETTKKISGNESDLSTICLDGYCALVAEDEPDLLILVTNILEDMGLDVIGASDGDEALVLLDEAMDEGKEIDILLTDVVMPGLNGVKLADLVSSLSPETKIIFMSGYPANGDMAPVELPEGITFIAKPVNYNVLAGLLLQKLRENTSDDISNVVDSIAKWQTSEVPNHEVVEEVKEGG